MSKKLLFILGLLPSSLIAGTTNIPCPIPKEHMKAEYFVYSAHYARALLKDQSTGIEWDVRINTKKLVIDKNVIGQFIRNNPYPKNAYEGSCLGCFRYTCTYSSPFSESEFFAGSPIKK